MGLKQLNDESKIFHIVMTTSQRAEVFVKTKLQDFCNIEPRDTGFAKTREQLQAMVSEYTVPPFLTEEWLGVIDYTPALEGIIKTNLQRMQEGYGRYLILCHNYRDFKVLKSLFMNNLVNTVYLSKLTFSDINYILGIKSSKLTEKIMKDVCNSYAQNIDAIFELSDYLNSGGDIQSKKDLEAICGLPDADLNLVILSLAKSVSEFYEKYDGKTVQEWNKSIKRSIPSKIKPLLKMSESYSAQYIRVSLDNIIYNMICLKELYLDCKIYRADDIKDLPEEGTGYDTATLQRLGKYFDKIMAIPTSSLLQIYEVLSEKTCWSSELDIILFIYKLFGRSVDKSAVF